MPRVKDSNRHRPLVSAALIVRNESHRLERCFESIRPFADELVVVDTGSVDGSAQLAAEEGARVVEFRWTGDFSEARNIALDVASGEWILYIDADERLRPADIRSVRDRLRSGPPARTVCLHPRPGWTGYREFRLWRSAPAIRFRGAIHETVLPSLTEAVGGDLSAVAPSGLVIDHFGYEGDLDAKYRRNLALLRRELDVDPDRVYLWHDLGCSLAGLGRHDEAEWAWVEAVARVRTKKTEPTPPDHVLPYLSLIASQAETGRFDALLEEAQVLFPEDKALWWWQARRLVSEGGYDEAVELFARLAAVDPAALDGAVVAYPRALFTTWAVDGLAACLFRLGRFAESAERYEELAELGVSRVEYRAKATVARARAVAHRSARRLSD